MCWEAKSALFSLACILAAYVKLPPEKFAPKKQGEGGKDLPTEPKKLQLNSAEELYAEIRDKNFNAVGSVLSKRAKIISAAFEVIDLCYLIPTDESRFNWLVHSASEVFHIHLAVAGCWSNQKSDLHFCFSTSLDQGCVFCKNNENLCLCNPNPAPRRRT